ncbi:hypothetical protein [Oscillatoria sp. HE19RPO]|uniref:hypothetical protein n=1 Tax=Oscillatoria sp. HE19RPO TaxID=2954806 RepID=UPI0020C3AFAD|nr:hypothetical protein [Oscillatoria sp. HE19RPO]
MSWNKIESFAVSNDERYIYVGNISGQILTINLPNFDIISSAQLNVGRISAVDIHLKLPYLATRLGGWKVNICKQDIQGTVKSIIDIDLRNIGELFNNCNDCLYQNFEPIDQAIAFHSISCKLAVKSQQNQVVELEFDDSKYKIVSCTDIDKNYPIVAVKYVKNSNKILVGTELGKIFLIENGNVIKVWHICNEDIHWFEHIENNIYVVASDSRQIIRLDISGQNPPLIGSKFAKDDVEHIVYDSDKCEAIASSFDRNIYAIDPISCESKRIIWKAPFKCRWVYVLKTHPNILIVQCRNGGLYKINTLTSKIISQIKDTPNALWTASQALNGKILIAGEGENVAELTPVNATNICRKITSFSSKIQKLNFGANSYTKRLAVNYKTDIIAFGRADGEVLIYEKGISRSIAHLDSAIRDLEFDNYLPILYVATENGILTKLSISNGLVLNTWTSRFPLWALALNSDKKVLAVSEREGHLVFIDLKTFLPILFEENHTYSKRMKWVDDSTLLYGSRSNLCKYDFSHQISSLYIEDTGNSIEDFAWDKNKKYLVLINYNRMIFLCDYFSGIILDYVFDQIDFSHGVMWIDDEINKSGEPNNFFTFGRTGSLQFYKIYEDKIISNGNLDLLI